MTQPSKLLYAIILLSCVSVTSSFADSRWIELQPESDSTLPAFVVSDTTNGITIELNVPGFYAESFAIGDIEYTSLKVPECGLKGEAGYPLLPFRTLLIPVSHGPRVESVIAKGVPVSALDQVTVIPAQDPQPDCGTCPPTPFAKNESLYQEDSWWPADPVLAIDEVLVRGQRFLKIELSPLRVNPVRKEVGGYPLLILQVDLSGEVDLEAERLKLLRAKDSFATLVDAETSDQLPTGIEYLVIAPDDLVIELAPLLTWKRLKGLTAEVVPMSAIGTTSDDIESFLLARYITDPDLTYVLLVGNHLQVPAQLVSGTVTDFYYSCLDGDDLLPDVVLGRISVDTAEELANVVDKIVSYERSPDQGSWHGKFLMAALLQDSDDYNCIADRWFFETATTVMHYARDAVGMGIYTAATSDRLSCSSYAWRPDSYPHRPDSGNIVPDADAALLAPGAAASQGISDAINAGVSIVLHRDHGNVTNWAAPYFSTTSISDLTNGCSYPVVFSINCLTGAFHSTGDCFAEAFMKKYPGGSVGVVAATRVSYSGYNDLIAHGLHDCIWDDYDPADGGNIYPSSLRPAVALAYAKYYMLYWAGASPYSTYQHEIFHWHGDPEMQIYTSVPVIASVSIEEPLPLGSDTLLVACDVEGAMVAVSDHGTLLGRATVSGGQALVTLDPAPDSLVSLDVVITGVNMTPWEGTIQTIAADGPWLTHRSHLIDDSSGNADGVVNPGEVVVLPISVENVGSEAAGGLSAALSSSSTWVTLTDDSATYPDVAVGELAPSNPDHFSFSLDSAAPHGERLVFTLDWLATGDYSGSTRFSVTACHALEISNVSISEVSDRSARVFWTTNVPAISKVSYGLLSPTESSVESRHLTTGHSLLLSELEPCTRYLLTISSESPGCYQVSDTNGGLSYSLTTDRRNMILADDVESDILVWTADPPWDTTDQDSHSPSHSWTDSPAGDYASSIDTSLTSPIIVLSNQSGTELSFYHKYNFESNYDKGSVEVKVNGEEWTELVRFSGILSEWSRQTVDLSDYDGSEIFKIRFRVDTDGGVTRDGWYIDDIEILSHYSCSKGFISLDEEVYTCESSAQVVVDDLDLDSDSNIRETATVTVFSDSELTGETLTLTEADVSSTTFIGTLAMSSSVATNDGFLGISDGDTVSAAYNDLDDGSGSPVVVTASAVADCLPPEISNVELTTVTPTSLLVSWLTNEPADSTVDWFTQEPPSSGSVSEQLLTTSHSLIIDGVSQCSNYNLAISATDAMGYTSTDDNSGLFYRLSTGIETEITVDRSSPVNIPDGDLTGISSPVSVGSVLPIVDVDVMVNIDHTYDDDIDIYLDGPGGTTVELSTDNGEFANNYEGTVFDDSAETSIVDGAAPFTGVFQPEQPLATFFGMPAAGKWNLRVVDDAPNDTGRLLSWQLRLKVDDTCDLEALFSDGFESGDTSSWSAAIR